MVLSTSGRQNFSVSVSCNTSVAILTLLEAVLQRFCSSTLCLQQGRGSTLVSLFLQKLLWRHNVTFLSRSSFIIFSLYFPSHSLVLDVFFTAAVSAIQPMSYKSSLEISCSNVLPICTVDPAVLRHMLLGILVQPCSHVGSKPWHQSSDQPRREIKHEGREKKRNATLLTEATIEKKPSEL